MEYTLAIAYVCIQKQMLYKMSTFLNKHLLLLQSISSLSRTENPVITFWFWKKSSTKMKYAYFKVT